MLNIRLGIWLSYWRGIVIRNLVYIGQILQQKKAEKGDKNGQELLSNSREVVLF